MNNLHVYDEQNHLLLTGVYVPTNQAVFEPCGAPNAASGTENWQRIPDDVGLARIVNAIAHKTIASEAATANKSDAPSACRLETWVIRPSGAGGRLSSWFTGELDSRYRLYAHRTAHENGEPGPLIWDFAYIVLNSLGMRPLRRREVSVRALQDGAQVLHEWLGVCRSGEQAIKAYVDSLGHPYQYINQPEGSS